MKNYLMKLLFIMVLFLPLSLNAGRDGDRVVTTTLPTKSVISTLEEPANTAMLAHFALDGADIVARCLLPRSAVELVEVPRWITLISANFYNIKDLLFIEDNSENRTQATLRLIKTGATLVHTAADLIDFLVYFGIEPTSYWSSISPYVAVVAVLGWGVAAFCSWWSSSNSKQE